ncbi:MAG: aspartate aminotransferase family protein [Gemmatimonadetes bacterium]|nr:aspartate aminotransferase family protein [Gemmatimonadota bacterium]MBI2401766.1 aspartate aminotransferase family protein [Gemmatimonadota bacterium]MBI2537339.1 aspartate aminotransferase family protein [Gemmatimonadota bacterium]MBI2614414.1 aspartate aminotransferase family protein [Gemmatimonadota bacterium]
MGVRAAGPDSAAVKAGHREYLFPCVTPYYADPVVVVRGLGLKVWDADGREYLDFFSGILTTAVGHCHPEVVERVQEQLATLGHSSTLYLTEAQVELARRLAEIAPGRLRQSFFTNSGTEAIETAIILACMYTGRTEIIALRYGYSGRSILASNLTAHSAWRPLPTTVPGIKHALSPYPYRCPFRSPCDDTCVDAFANDLEELIVTTTNGKPAAFIAETIQGVGGYIVPPPGYFQRMAEIVHRYGGLFICDEVQAGFGRTGEHWFGIEHWGVEPDIMVMAKGIASGFPVGATITRPEIAAAWTTKTISTFGGNPVSMAAGIATNEVMVRENVPARAAARGKQLRTGLDELGRRYGWIGDVRGMGLMQALEIVEDKQSKTPNPKKAKGLLETAKDEGLLIGLGGLNGHVIRLGPSLLVTEEETADALARMSRACTNVDRS